MSRSSGTTLYVTGFGHGTRARDLAYEFERYVLSADTTSCSNPHEFMSRSRFLRPNFWVSIPKPFTHPSEAPRLHAGLDLLPVRQF